MHTHQPGQISGKAVQVWQQVVQLGREAYESRPASDTCVLFVVFFIFCFLLTDSAGRKFQLRHVDTSLWRVDLVPDRALDRLTRCSRGSPVKCSANCPRLAFRREAEEKRQKMQQPKNVRLGRLPEARRHRGSLQRQDRMTYMKTMLWKAVRRTPFRQYKCGNNDGDRGLHFQFYSQGLCQSSGQHPG